jgi:hypothetical protein
LPSRHNRLGIPLPPLRGGHSENHPKGDGNRPTPSCGVGLLSSHPPNTFHPIREIRVIRG